jgi:hypothetical protein
VAGIDQPFDDLTAIELTASDQLKQAKRRAVKRVVATTGSR